MKAVKEQLSDAALSQMKSLVAQQKSALNKGPVLHQDLQNLKGDKEVSVIVELSEYPVALVKGINKVAGKSTSKVQEKSIQQKIISQQQKFKNNMSAKGIKAKIGFSYNYTFNGMALKLKAGQVKELLKIEGVKMVEPDLERHALGQKLADDEMHVTMNTSSPFLKVPDVWKLGYEGQGVKVAVLDTGIDYNHPEFKDVYKGGYNFIDQSNSANYTRDRGANDPYETTPSERPEGKPEFNANGSSFYTEHGTHVAGTIAAQGKNEFGIKGLAPKVELYAYRVLGAYGSGANSGVIAGIEKAVQEKMDIINLSLGGSNNNQTSSDSIAINNAAFAGVTAVIATGNDGPNRGTIGSPGVAAFAISVANSTVPEKTMSGQANVTVEGSEAKAYNMNLMGWKFGTDLSKVLNGTYELVAVPGLGEEKDYEGLDVKGKVALISRGTIPFVDKIANAKKAGAVATIIHNNTGTAPAGVFLGDSFAFIPTFDMSTTDGNALRTALQTKKVTVTFGNFESGKTAGDEINSSSSRGPANPNFDIKPDVSAPGTNIMSSVPRYGKENPDADYSEAYDRFTGTSMATPHVAGIAALLKSEHPNWTPFDIKVAISNTAKQLDVSKYDVFSQGPGRVQPLAAATTEALAYAKDKTSFSGKEYDNVKGTITFGNVVPQVDNSTTVTRDIVVKNLTGKASDYTVTVQTTKRAKDTLAEANVTVDQASFNLAANGEIPLKVTLNVPKGSPSAGNEIFGYINISNGKTNLTLPFAANFAPPTGLKIFSIDSTDISPNGDGKLEGTTVKYEFHDKQLWTEMELWDALNPEGGKYGDGYLGLLDQKSSTPIGLRSIPFDGKYYSYDTSKWEPAADGVYTLDLTTYNSSIPQLITAIVTQNYIGPIFVKTTAPKIKAEDNFTVTSASFDLSGAIEDSYIDWSPIVNELFDEPYNVNDKLHVSYELTNSKGEKKEATAIILSKEGKFTASINGLTAGENKVKLIVDDAAQNHAEKEITILVDDVDAPITTANVAGTEGKNGWYTSDVTVALSATDGGAGVKSTEYKLNGGEWKTYSEPIKLTDGTTTVDYRSTDNVGNVEDTNSLTVKVDTVAPKVSGVEDGYYNRPVKITFNEGDATLNGKPFNSGTEVSDEGTYTLVVTDEAGNSTEVNFTIDKKVPQITGVADKGIYNHFVTIFFDKGTATLNGKAFKSGTVRAEGVYTLVVTDKAGNKTIVHFTIDVTPPKISGVNHFGSYNRDVKFSFDEKTGLLNGKSVKSGVVVSKEGSYLIEVVDAARNKSYKFFTIDKKAPVVTGVKNKGLYNKNIKISFNEGAATLNGKTVKNNTTVRASGSYTLVIKDAAGNKTTVKFTIDKKAPATPKVNKVTVKTTKITGKAEAGAKVTVKVGNKVIGQATANNKGNFTVKISKQKVGSALSITVKDKAGNISKVKKVTVKKK